MEFIKKATYFLVALVFIVIFSAASAFGAYYWGKDIGKSEISEELESEHEKEISSLEEDFEEEEKELKRDHAEEILELENEIEDLEKRVNSNTVQNP